MAFTPRVVHTYYKYLYTIIAAYSSTSPMVLVLEGSDDFCSVRLVMVDLIWGYEYHGVANRAVKFGGAIWSMGGLRGDLSRIPYLGELKNEPQHLPIHIDLKRPTCNRVTMEKTQVFQLVYFLMKKHSGRHTTR